MGVPKYITKLELPKRFAAFAELRSGFYYPVLRELGFLVTREGFRVRRMQAWKDECNLMLRESDFGIKLNHCLMIPLDCELLLFDDNRS